MGFLPAEDHKLHTTPTEKDICPHGELWYNGINLSVKIFFTSSERIQTRDQFAGSEGPTGMTSGGDLDSKLQALLPSMESLASASTVMTLPMILPTTTHDSTQFP